jgi:hypothetical protein
MNKQHYNEGYEAFKAGRGFLDNPYMDKTGLETAMRVWIDGYVQSLIDARD